MNITQKEIDIIISNSSGMMEAFRKVSEEAYKKGFNIGKDVGYANGLDHGNTQGYIEGILQNNNG